MSTARTPWGGGAFKPRRRWLLVGNAINVAVAEWLGGQLSNRRAIDMEPGTALEPGAPWPVAAWSDGSTRRAVPLGAWPVSRTATPLAEFLRFPGQPLSLRATRGFRQRILASRLRLKPGFAEAIGAHLERMEGGVADREDGEPFSQAA